MAKWELYKCQARSMGRVTTLHCLTGIVCAIGLLVEPHGTPGNVVTVPEVAEYLRVTTKTVYKLISEGELPSFRVGRAVRLRRADVEAFVSRAGKLATAPTEEDG